MLTISDSAKIGIIFDTNNFFAPKKLFLVIFRYHLHSSCHSLHDFR